MISEKGKLELEDTILECISLMIQLLTFKLVKKNLEAFVNQQKPIFLKEDSLDLQKVLETVKEYGVVHALNNKQS